MVDYAVYCNEDNGWCGVTSGHKNAQVSDIYDWEPESCHDGIPDSENIGDNDENNDGIFFYLEAYDNNTFKFLVYQYLQVSIEILSCSFAAISVDASCYNTNNEVSETINTPNYPSNYPNNKQCSWKITGPIRTKIQIQNFFYDLEPNSACRYDYLKIYDGPSSSSNRNALLCGDSSFGEGMTSSSNTLFLEFRSDSSSTYKGFQLYYTIIGM